MYPVLLAMMKSKKIGPEKLAEITGITVQSIYNKLAGRTDWTLSEAKKIKEILESRENIEVLFFKN